MNNLYKLKDVCKMYGLTRRTIQGYEKKGLIKPSSRNESGHLLYDEETTKKIAVISFLNKTLFPLDQVKSCFDGNPECFKLEVEKNIKTLGESIKNEKARLSTLNDISKLNFNDSNLIDEIFQIITMEEKINEKDN